MATENTSKADQGNEGYDNETLLQWIRHMLEKLLKK